MGRPSVLLISTSGSGGGAALVAAQMHRGFLKRGYFSRLVVGREPIDTSNCIVLPALDGRHRDFLRRQEWQIRSSPWGRALGALMRPRGAWQRFRGWVDTDFPESRHLVKLADSCDVVIVHNVHGQYLDYRILAEIGRRKPVLCMLHDCWWFTGICSHPFGCLGYRSACGQCPLFEGRRWRDQTRRNFVQRLDLVERGRLHALAPSRWIFEKMQESAVGRAFASRHLLHNSVDTDFWSPGHVSRLELGLPESGLCLLAAGANYSRNSAKGWPHLLKAWLSVREQLPHPRKLVVLGFDEPVNGLPDVIALPFTHDAKRSRDYFRACDAFVHLAEVENCPLVLLEALASGLPIVASNRGGIPEILEGVGEVVELEQPAQITRALLALGDAQDRGRRQEAGRRHALQSFAEEDWFSSLEELLADLLGGQAFQTEPGRPEE